MVQKPTHSNSRAALTARLALAGLVTLPLALVACGYQPSLGDYRPVVDSYNTTWPPMRRIAASASPWRCRRRPNMNASNG